MKIRDIAKLAGVSTATVSHVINGTRFVSEELKQKVREVIEHNGYTPNAHARNLASRQSRTFGLILSDLSNPFFPDLVKSIQECAITEGYDVTMANTNYDPQRTLASVQRMLEQRVSGRSWIMDDDYTIADIATWPWVRNLVGFYGAGELVGYAEFTNVQRVLEAFVARPAVARGLAIPAAP